MLDFNVSGRIMVTAAMLAAMLATILVLQGCGHKGPLMLPAPPAQKSGAQTSGAQTSGAQTSGAQTSGSGATNPKQADSPATGQDLSTQPGKSP
jgi:predicted small lipoprotein YifL